MVTPDHRASFIVSFYDQLGDRLEYPINYDILVTQQFGKEGRDRVVLYDPSAINLNGISETYVTEILLEDVSGGAKLDLRIDVLGVGDTEPYPNVLTGVYEMQLSTESVKSKDFRP